MKIRIDDDFDLYKIAYSGQCFRVRELSRNTFRFVTGYHFLDMTQLNESEYEISCSIDEWESVWYPYFDLDTCYTDIRKSIPSNDTYASYCADKGQGIRILNQDKFEMLISFIISQRKSIPAIKSAVEKLCTLFGTKIECTEDLYSFPTPEQLSLATDEDLQKCGLGYRVPYIKNAVQQVYRKDVDLDSLSSLTDELLFDELKNFNGVGDKVSNCVCLFGYHRVAMAPIDTWIKKVIDIKYNGINPFPSYGQYAGIIQQFIFYSAQHEKDI